VEKNRRPEKNFKPEGDDDLGRRTAGVFGPPLPQELQTCRILLVEAGRKSLRRSVGIWGSSRPECMWSWSAGGWRRLNRGVVRVGWSGPRAWPEAAEVRRRFAWCGSPFLESLAPLVPGGGSSSGPDHGSANVAH
jgi:hypothetical protein